MSPPGGSPSGSRLVLILGALSAFGPLSLDLYLPSLPSLARDLHTTTAASALTLTACLIGLAVGQLLSGPLSDQLGRRRPVIVGVAVYAAASGACMVAPNIWTLVALRLLQGFAGAAGIVVARAVVRDLHTGVDAAMSRRQPHRFFLPSSIRSFPRMLLPQKIAGTLFPVD